MSEKNENLLREMESIVRMDISAPASEQEILKLPSNIPDGVIDFWRMHNGVEINVPGTRLYSIEEALNEKTELGSQFGEIFPIGIFNFGDMLFMDDDCRVIQIDHEDGSEFLVWDSLTEFLEDELADCYEDQ